MTIRTLLARSGAVALIGGAAFLSVHLTVAARQPAAVADADVDAVFSRWTSETPGCAVGVGAAGRSVLQRAYGMADLEHDVRNTPDTIFEAGSVSKQFTAAAVLLLARDGKLSLDDAVRTHVPELPEYGAPLTIRHMLQHTSGLRDWGAIAGVAGWPRTLRAHTHAHVLDIISRQGRLNFVPGARYSYSNSGYNLAAMIVSRVSGRTFAEFTRTRLFEPLGMTRTSWRDDFTRIVKGRAIAYSMSDDDGFHTDMPFENAHGNGGLLTTVGDLLRWNENFVTPKVGDAEFVRLQQTAGRLSGGIDHGYAMGLSVGGHKGVREVSHSGSTAGYSAFLTRFPDQHLSVAVLCNVSTNATRFAHAVADLYLGSSLTLPAAPARVTVAEADLDARVGIYRNVENGFPMLIVRDKDALRVKDGPVLTPLSPARFGYGDGDLTLEFDARGASLAAPNGMHETFERVPPARPTLDQLAQYAGSFVSDEAEITLKIVPKDGALELTRRPDARVRLTPLYADAFEGERPYRLVRFHRDASGALPELSIGTDRAWDLRFRRSSQPTH
jgi:CubicO group peptidase (beta-lactamase class C family)